jgi:hypothetical protein
MTSALRTAICLVLFAAASPGIAEQSATNSGDAISVTTASLRNGDFTFWVSSRSQFDAEGLIFELKTDYPDLQVHWQVFRPDAFLPAIQKAELEKATLPDAVFVDNAAQQQPLMKSGRFILMAGRARLADRGWWMVPKESSDQSKSLAFLIWLERSPKWKPPLPSIRMLTGAEERRVGSIAEEMMQTFGKSSARPREELIDPSIASFDWNFVRQRYTSQGQSYTPTIDFVGGNRRLAYVLLSTLEKGDDSYGLLHSLVILRKDKGRWRVLLFSPDSSLPRLEDAVFRLGAIGLNNDVSHGKSTIALLAPADHERTTRFPKTEVAFEENGEVTELTGIESQFLDPSHTQWSISGITWVKSPDDKIGIQRLPMPFGVGMQPHRWRVWSVDKSGVVTLSEWRTVDFTN